MRGLKFKDFKIELYNNNFYILRFEYVIKPINNTGRKLCYHNKVYHLEVCDPSASRTKKIAKKFAKDHVNGMYYTNAKNMIDLIKWYKENPQ